MWCQNECTKVLLASGASVALTTERGETATDVATRYKNWAARELLEKLGLMISIKTNWKCVIETFISESSHKEN